MNNLCPSTGVLFSFYMAFFMNNNRIHTTIVLYIRILRLETIYVYLIMQKNVMRKWKCLKKMECYGKNINLGEKH